MLFFDILGYIAIVFAILGFITHNRNHMLIYGIISTGLFGISIAGGYGGYNGLAVSLISIIIKLFSLYINKEKLKYIKYSAPIVSLILFFFLPEGLIGLIPTISMFFIIIGDSQKDVLKMKLFYYGSNLSWLIYGIILFSIPAILFDLFGFIAITYGVYSIYKKRKNNLIETVENKNEKYNILDNLNFEDNKKA